MVDTVVKSLVERTIDSPLKLQLLLLCSEHHWLHGTAAQMAQRVYRDIWSTREALRELTEDGIFASSGANEPVYSYYPRPDLIEPITRLCRVYNEPIERDGLQRLVRDAASYASYRRTNRSFDYERWNAV